jgi:sugar-phosphatase
MQYKQVRLVIFDMDGVIIDSEPFWQEVEKQVFAKLGFDVTSLVEGGKTKGMRLDEVIRDWQGILGFDQGISEAIYSEIIQGIISRVESDGVMIPYVKEAIDFFIKKGIPLSLASGSNYEIIDAVMDKFDLRDRFSVIYSAEDEIYGKPHPGIFLTTATLMEVSPNNTVVIEDSLNGVIAAKAASMRVIAIPPDSEQGDVRFSLADCKITSLSEIPQAASMLGFEQ